MRFVSELDKMSSANVRQKRQRSRNESGASDKSSNSEASNPTPAKVIFFVYNDKTSQSNLVRSAYTRCRGGNGSESRVNNALNLKTLKVVPTAAM